MSAKKRNYYRVLGIPKGATPEEIRLSYRALAMRFHPDKNPDNPESTERFHEILEAYEVLSDPIRRQQYDQMGALFRIDGRPPEKEDISAFVSETISRVFVRKKPVRGSDIHREISIPLEQVITGNRVDVQILRDCLCGFCGGIGAAPDGTILCSECNGNKTQKGLFFRRTCNRCGGLGRIITKRCKKCGGTGRNEKQETLSVLIPKGIQAGQTLQIKGKGNDGSIVDQQGNLFLRIQFQKHPFFERRGEDLFCDVPVLWTEATLGATIPVPTLTGSSLIRIPKSTPTHRTFRLKGKGLISANGEQTGDIHYRIVIEVPVLNTELETEIIALQEKLLQLEHPTLQSFRKSILSSE